MDVVETQMLEFLDQAVANEGWCDMFPYNLDFGVQMIVLLWINLCEEGFQI